MFFKIFFKDKVKDKDKDLFIGPQEFVVGYSNAPEQPQSSTRPIMSFSRYDEDRARTSHHTHCCIWSSPCYALRQGRLFFFFLNSMSELFFFFKSLLAACPAHTNPPGSGLGTGSIVFDKHIDKSTQQMNSKVHSYIFFTMRLAVTHGISSS